MPSSLAAALAASKKGGHAAVDTSVKNEDEHPSSRPSSLQQHNQVKDGAKRDERETATKGPREKIKKHAGTSNNDHTKKNGDKIKDPIQQREKTSPNEGNKIPGDGGGCSKSTTKRGKKKGAEVLTPAKNNDVSTGQMVFVCDIPSDGDDNDDDGDCKDCADGYDGGRLTKSAKRRGRKNNKDKAPTSPVEIADNSPREIVFVCDIPSDGDDDYEDYYDGDHRDGGDGNFDDDDGGDGADEGGGGRESEVDGLDRNEVVTTDGRQKNTARSRGNGDRGGGGGEAAGLIVQARGLNLQVQAGIEVRSCMEPLVVAITLENAEEIT